MATAASSPSQFLVTLSGLPVQVPGAFMTQSGGNKTGAVKRFRPGGSSSEEVSGGSTTREDLVITREWRRDRDLAIWKWADAHINRVRGVVTVQPLDEDKNAYGDPIVFADSLLTGATKPDVNSDAEDELGMLSLTFAVSGDIS